MYYSNILVVRETILLTFTTNIDNNIVAAPPLYPYYTYYYPSLNNITSCKSPLNKPYSIYQIVTVYDILFAI